MQLSLDASAEIELWKLRGGQLPELDFRRRIE